jgi:hypothetical protein
MGKNQDPGSGINIPDPQHWLQYKTLRLSSGKNLQLPGAYQDQIAPLGGLTDQEANACTTRKGLLSAKGLNGLSLGRMLH